MSVLPWVPAAGGLLLMVRVTPKGGRDGVDGIAELADGRSVLKVRLRASASEGEANLALVKLLSGTLGVPRSEIAIVSGSASRLKRVRITGEPSLLAAALEEAATIG